MNPDAVRPGTSDALTARTIDATIYPPLVRAQETAAALIPRLAEAAAPLSSPLLLGALALTLVFSWVAIRMRYRPSALVLGALLVMTLTSFNPAQEPDQTESTGAEDPRTTVGATSDSRRNGFYAPLPEADAPGTDDNVDPVQVDLPPDLAERLPDWSRDAMHSAERMMRDNERMREIMKQIRYRLREEVRRQHWRQMLADRRARVREYGLIESP